MLKQMFGVTFFETTKVTFDKNGNLEYIST